MGLFTFEASNHGSICLLNESKRVNKLVKVLDLEVFLLNFLALRLHLGKLISDCLVLNLDFSTHMEHAFV